MSSNDLQMYMGGGNPLLARRRMMARKKGGWRPSHNLPAGFREVESIRRNDGGVAYLILPTDGADMIYADVSPTRDDNRGIVLGNSSGGYDYRAMGWDLLENVSGNFLYGKNDKYHLFDIDPIGRHRYYLRNDGCGIDDEHYEFAGAFASWDTYGVLCATNQSGNEGSVGSYYNYNYLYECGAGLNGELVHQYIPCERELDNVYGVYDIIAGGFITNPNCNPNNYFTADK